jgi:hypothetical protein
MMKINFPSTEIGAENLRVIAVSLLALVGGI